MTCTSLAYGSTGGTSVDFYANSTGPAEWKDVREIKLCDLCGRNFLRHIPLYGKPAQRDCDDCTKRVAAQKAENDAILEKIRATNQGQVSHRGESAEERRVRLRTYKKAWRKKQYEATA